MQLDEDKRGFSFSKEGPLDMRMDSNNDLTARDIVNSWSEKMLGEVLRDYGEEPRWRRIAKALVQARRRKPFTTTTQLAEVISEEVGRGSRKKLHPATLVFQALRICVNRELESVQEGISKAMQILAPEGRIGVISFHSLEDRIVKNLFREASKPIRVLEEDGKKTYLPLLKLLTKKPLTPSVREMRSNPRSRSAKLRFAQKCVAGGTLQDE